MTDTLSGEGGWGPDQGSTSLSPPSRHALTPSPKRRQRPLGAGPGTALTTALKVAIPGRQTQEGRTGQLRGSSLSPSASPGEVSGCRGVSGLMVGVLFLPPPRLGLFGLRPRGAASHDGAAVAAQRALEAQGGVHVFAAGAADALEQLAEEQQDVPVVLGRALHVAALPGLAHQV